MKYKFTKIISIFSAIIFGISFYGASAFAEPIYTATIGGTPNVSGNFIFSETNYTNGIYYLYDIPTGSFPFVTHNSYISTSLPSNVLTASSGGTPDISGGFAVAGTFGGYTYYTNGIYFVYSYPNPNYPGMFQPATYCYASDSLGASTTDYFYYAGLCTMANGFNYLNGIGSYSGHVTLTQQQTLPDNYFSSLGNAYEGTYIANGSYSGTFSVSEYSPPVAPSLTGGTTVGVMLASVGEVSTPVFNSFSAYLYMFAGLSVAVYLIFEVKFLMDYGIKDGKWYRKDKKKTK